MVPIGFIINSQDEATRAARHGGVVCRENLGRSKSRRICDRVVSSQRLLFQIGIHPYPSDTDHDLVRSRKTRVEGRRTERQRSIATARDAPRGQQSTQGVEEVGFVGTQKDVRSHGKKNKKYAATVGFMDEKQKESEKRKREKKARKSRKAL